MAWRLAKSLEVLRAECNAYAPNRSKSYDGTIGDAAHATRASAHNPNDAGVVCGEDITHSPSTGMDAHKLARRIAADPPSALCYVISNAQVARWSNGWKWVAYKGSNQHKTHAHFRVGRGSDSEPTNAALYDSTTPWHVAELMEEDMAVDNTSENAFNKADKILKDLGILDAAGAHPWKDAAGVGLVWTVVQKATEPLYKKIARLEKAIEGIPK